MNDVIWDATYCESRAMPTKSFRVAIKIATYNAIHDTTKNAIRDAIYRAVYDVTYYATTNATCSAIYDATQRL